MSVLLLLSMFAVEACEDSPKATECLPPVSEEEQAERAQRGPTSVLGAPLATCSLDPLTGWFRTGSCKTGPRDRGVHVVCASMTEDFLSFTKAKGNDLSSPRGSFPGLKPGDRWCLCASRWEEARRAGHAPKVVLNATDDAALRVVEMKSLKAHALPTKKP
ncbi:MAG: DUF2237 domain-containing protein [Myxococcota bacterium]